MILEKDENSQKFAAHLSNINFKFDKYEYKFDQLYNFFKEGNFPNDDFKISFSFDKKICSLFYIGNNRIIFYFYNHIFNLELFNLKDETKEVKEICSTPKLYV